MSEFNFMQLSNVVILSTKVTHKLCKFGLHLYEDLVEYV